MFFVEYHLYITTLGYFTTVLKLPSVSWSFEWINQFFQHFLLSYFQVFLITMDFSLNSLNSWITKSFFLWQKQTKYNAWKTVNMANWRSAPEKHQVESLCLMARINVSPSTSVWASHPALMSPGNRWDSCVHKELMSLPNAPHFFPETVLCS